MKQPSAFASGRHGRAHALILVVDDMPTNLKVMRGILESAGYNMTFATSGQQALERVAVVHPDLILLDLMMPGMDGLEVCRKIKQQPDLVDIPIIFLTASHESDHLVDAFSSGAVDYLTKPFKKAELLARVKTHLDLQHLRHQALRQAQQERTLRHIMQGMRRSLNLAEVLPEAAPAIQTFLGADALYVVRLSGSLPPTVVARAHAAKRSAMALPDLRHYSTVTQTTLLQPQASAPSGWLEKHGTKHQQWLAQQGITAELIVPIVVQGERWGLLIAHHQSHRQRKGRPFPSDCFQPWAPEDIQATEQLTEQLSIAIQQAELHAELQTANQELERLSQLDGLTQVANRRHFERTLKKEWRRLRREQQPLSIALIDIDYFKLYNDTYGHLAGDDCLQTVAQILNQSLKRPADLLARYGGEEFVVVLPNTDSQGAAALAEEMQQRLQEKAISHAGVKAGTFVTISIGIASTVPCPRGNPKKLVDVADKALYEAKHRGRSQYVLATCDGCDFREECRSRGNDASSPDL